MKDRNQMMDDYFEDVTRDQLLHDIKETGMLDHKPKKSIDTKKLEELLVKHAGATVVKPYSNRVKHGYDPYNALRVSNKRKKRPSISSRRSANN
ncbi:hypothetical protein [Priestia megaterium]|uniref:hypothetical protein n=1 Tax=Priestia megaterium TaxID=1404 RepID=UPI002570F989|nr:hypothetical protein [Priestia megaterium]WJD83907.1 hypothetical protein QRD24_28645 [Priestia megaterium]